MEGYYEGSIPWLKIGDLTDGIVTRSEESIREAGLRNSAAKLVEPGNLLIAMYGASIGKLGIPAMRCATNQAIAHCVPDRSKVSTEYLFQALLALRNDLIALGKGGAQPNISQTVLRAFCISVPPLPVQERIVELARRTSEARGQAHDRLVNASRLLQRFRQSVLAAACSGWLTADWRAVHSEAAPQLEAANAQQPKKVRPLVASDLDEIPNGWMWTQVENVLPPSGIFDGPFGSNLKSSDYTDSGARVIRLENIGHLRFLGEKRTYVSRAKYDELAKHAVRPGDVVFSSFVEERIRVCVLPDDLDRDALAKADCFTLRPIPAVDPRYLTLQLASPRTFRQLRGDIHGATRPRVTTQQVRALPLPVCSLAEQCEIVLRFDHLLAAADAISNRIDSASRTAEASGRAVLTIALGGGATTPAQR